MQALTAPTVFPCYAAADRPVAERLAALLERGSDIRVFLDEGQMPDGGDLAEKAREARMADIVIVLFSREFACPRAGRARSGKTRWSRNPRSEGVRIAFLKCDDCIPPRVLTPMFEATRLRDVKRWVRGARARRAAGAEYSADLEVLGIAHRRPSRRGDRGAFALAREFARVFGGDFDAVLHLDCVTGTLADMAGDLAWQVGLQLEGELAAQSRAPARFLRSAALSDRAGRRRAGGPGLRRPLLHAGSRGTRRASRDMLRSWRANSMLTEDWTEACRLARQARRVAHDQFRLAECFEIMSHGAPWPRNTTTAPVVDEASRELVWILDGWGRTEEARQIEQVRAMEFDEQLPLFFE